MARDIEDLSPKEVAYCEFFTALGEDTCSHQQRSCIAAGYAEKSASVQAWKLMQRPAIRAKIAELHAKRMHKHLINPERILFDIEHIRIKALEKDDLSTALRALEDFGKYFSMFTEQLVVITEEQRKLSEKDKEQARKMAALLLSHPELEAGAETKQVDLLRTREQTGITSDVPIEAGAL